MKSYRTIDEVFEDRRKGVNLSEVIENILHSPYILSQIDTPFDVVEGLYPGDYVDASTDVWTHLPVELQIKYANAYQEWYAKNTGHPSVEGVFNLPSNVEILMRLIPPMRFLTNTYDLDSAILKIPFWLGKYEITQEQWGSVMGVNPSLSKYYPEIPNLPVDSVSFKDCQSFCEKTGMIIPTTNQWICAQRAGTTTKYSFGDDVAQVVNYGWCEENSNIDTHPVGEKKPNAWGLYDMLGNVAEWTSGKKSYDKYGISHEYRTVLGGSYANDATYTRCDMGFNIIVENRYAQTGLRVMRKI